MSESRSPPRCARRAESREGAGDDRGVADQKRRELLRAEVSALRPGDELDGVPQVGGVKVERRLRGRRH